jgi:ribosomal protein S12 methylthiotransferase accessory factor YcaO
MHGVSKGPFFQALLEASSCGSDNDSPFLAVGPITRYLKSKNLSHELHQAPMGRRFEGRVFCCSAIIHRSNGSKIPGYSLSTSDSSRAIALIEAFERLCFCDVLPDHPEIYFSKDEINDAEIIGSEWSTIFYGQPLNETIGEPAQYLIGRRVGTDAPVAIDRAFVIGDNPHYPSTTSGFACHMSYPRAALSACFEVVERDTLLRNWFSRISPSKTPSLTDELLSLVQEMLSLDEFEISVSSYYSGNGAHVYVAAVYSNKHRFFFLGTGAHLSKKTAYEKAIREVLSIWILDFHGLKIHGDRTTFSVENQIRRHARQFDQLKDFFVKSQAMSDRVPQMTLEQQLDALNQHYQFVLIPVTIPDFDNKEVVFMKAFSPQAVPLFKSEFPLLLPPDFATLVKGQNPYHPY